MNALSHILDLVLHPAKYRARDAERQKALETAAQLNARARERLHDAVEKLLFETLQRP